MPPMLQRRERADPHLLVRSTARCRSTIGKTAIEMSRSDKLRQTDSPTINQFV
jgi:hypothetical protein